MGPTYYDYNIFFQIVAVLSAILIGFILGFLTKKSILIRQKEQEFKKLLQEEKKYREEAENAIRARDEFLSIASHELKTPLTTITLRIQSTIDSILNQSLASFSGEKLMASLTIANEQTARLQKLIKDLLNFSLITRGKLDLEFHEADLNEIVKSTLDRFEDHLNLAGCSLKYETSGEIKGLWDQVRIEQALSNLLTNSIKYGQGEPVEVVLKKEGQTARLAISDKGIGIEKDQQKIIFERFKRATKDGKYQGLGIGLFIVKQIIEAHGGKISVKSKIGQSTTFTINLPIKFKEQATTTLKKASTASL